MKVNAAGGEHIASAASQFQIQIAEVAGVDM
jgi:hypothetical protein